MKLTLTIIAIIFIALGGKAQNGLGVHPGKNAIFIYCGSELPKSFSYQISRKEIDQNDWQVLKTLDFPRDKMTWEGRIFRDAKDNTNISLPDSAIVGLLWNKLKTSNMDDSLYSWNSYPGMLFACGTGWWDGSVEPNKRYEYKIEKKQEGRFSLLKTFDAVSIPGPEPNYVIQPDSIAGNGTSVLLDFKLMRYAGMMGCKVYRGNYLRGNFEQIHPVVMYTTRDNNKHLIIMDASVVNKAQYSYYIVPFDAYGNDGQPTDTINIYNTGVNTIPALVTHLHAVSQEKDNLIRLSWKLSNQEDIVSIDIYKAFVYDGYYTRIGNVAPGDTSFLDYNVKPVTTYFYTLVLNTAYGRTYPSARIPVIYKASKPNLFPPSNLKAIRQGNTVKLSWNSVGTDIRGYYVYRSNSFTSPMQPVSGIILNSDSVVSYVDSLDQVPESPVLVYAVASENTSYGISPISIRVSVAGKAAFMPVPTNLNARVNGHKILLFWDDLTENYPFMTGYWVYRRMAGLGETESPKIRLNITPTAYGVNSFVDSTAVEGLHYLYSLESIGLDTSDVSASSLETGAIIPLQLPLSPGQLRAMNTKGGVLLQWTNPIDDHVENIRILRAKKGESLEPIQMLDAESTEWTDKNINNDTVYFYGVLTVDDKGRQSIPDEPLGIRTSTVK